MVSWAGELPPLTLSGRRVGGLRVWGGRFLLRLQIEVFLEPARKVEGLRRRGGTPTLEENFAPKKVPKNVFLGISLVT